MTQARIEHPLNGHVSDGALLALCDSQRDAELEPQRAHVDQCAECRARLGTVSARASHVRTALASIPVPTVARDEFLRRVASARQARPRPIWQRPALLAAAAVIVVAGAAVASSIQQLVRRRVESPQMQPVSPPVATPSAQPVNHSGATVSFGAEGPTFTVRFDSLPAAGTLTARRAIADLVTARVATGAGTGGDAMVVLPNELRVRNTSTARASYEVLLPPAVTRLRVVVAGRTVFEGTPPSVIQLDRSK